jgi:hypothetical protein
VPQRLRLGDIAVMSILAVSLRVVFWAATGRVWEDALITIAHARNAVEGLGLTHHPGEPVSHGFSSALSVLIPLAGEAISSGFGIAALRFATLIAVVVAIVAADALGRRLGLERWARLLVMGYLAVDANHIFYGMSGMETQVAVAALLVSAWAVTARHPLAGVALGVALLARPDFVIWTAILWAHLAIRDRSQLGRVVAGTVVVIVPWVAFTTFYYGSPVPQTIVAKAIAFTTLPAELSPGALVTWIVGQIASHLPGLTGTFMPFFEDSLAVRSPVPFVLLVAISAGVVALAVIGAIDRRRDALWTPIIAFVGAYLVYRVLFLQTIYSDWYLPPFTAMTVLLVGAGVQRLAREGRPRLAPAVAIVFVLVFAFPLPWVFSVERAIQAEVEDGVRTPTSIALGTLVPPGEGVGSESAGYIEFWSRVTLYDYPGLTSRVGLATVRDLPRENRKFHAFIDALRPPWLVLRPTELDDLRSFFPATAALYQEVKRFGGSVNEVEWFGYAKATVDAEFIILRRVP